MAEPDKILVKQMHNGVEVISLRPNQKMMAFAFALTLDPTCRGKQPLEILVHSGIASDQRAAEKVLRNWRDAYNPYFDEWLEDVQIKYHPKNIKNMLEFVGLNEAFKGEFTFWKAFAIREKVIQPDQTNIGVIPADLGAFNDWTEDQVNKHRDSLLESLRALEDQGSIDVAPGPPEGGPESDSRGALEMLQEPVALPESVGSDGECALDLTLDL